MMISFFGHLSTVLTHKWWVFYYCCKFGIPVQGLLHDLSKFSKTEFGESYNYYTGTGSPINVCRQVNGYSNAWLHHKGRNKHHYEYWLDVNDDKIVPIEIPEKYAKEMCCDWLGAGRAYMGKEFTIQKEKDFVVKKLHRCGSLIHPNTIKYVEDFFNKL